MSRYNEILQKVKWESWQSYINGKSELVGDIKEKAAKLYAEECVKASLEKASENGTVIHKDYGVVGQWEVNKESITNPENILLL